MNKSFFIQKGTSLLEALIACLVVAIGLLGIAMLQVNTTTQEYHSQLSYQAILQIYDMADRMRANPSGISSGLYNAISTPIGTYPNCNTVTCSPNQLAQFDAGDWNTNNAALLPSGQGTVTGAGSGSNFTIQVQWTEPNVGNRTMSMNLRV